MQQDGTFDALLIEGLLLAASEEAEELKNVKTVDFSPTYLKFRDKLLKDPFRYAKRRKRPLWKKALQIAACLLLAMAIGLGAVMTVSPVARAEIVRWFREVYETYFFYRFVDDYEPGELPVYEIGEVPEGYVETDQEELGDFRRVTYQNTNGDRLWFAYVWMRDGFGWALNSVGVEVLDVDVNGCKGEFYYYPDESGTNCVIWRDEDASLMFCVDMFGKKEEILHVAESVFLAR